MRCTSKFKQWPYILNSSALIYRCIVILTQCNIGALVWFYIVILEKGSKLLWMWSTALFKQQCNGNRHFTLITCDTFLLTLQTLATREYTFVEVMDGYSTAVSLKKVNTSLSPSKDPTNCGTGNRESNIVRCSSSPILSDKLSLYSNCHWHMIMLLSFHPILYSNVNE